MVLRICYAVQMLEALCFNNAPRLYSVELFLRCVNLFKTKPNVRIFFVGLRVSFDRQPARHLRQSAKHYSSHGQVVEAVCGLSPEHTARGSNPLTCVGDVC